MPLRLNTTGWIAGLIFGGVFAASLALVAIVSIEHDPSARKMEWWQHEVIYHVFIPSFYEAADEFKADGYGDIAGRINRKDSTGKGETSKSNIF